MDLVIAVPKDAAGFNEAMSNVVAGAGYFVANNIFSRLVTHEIHSDAPSGDLALHWEVLDGGQRYRFILNPLAHWHDSAPLTSADVAYTHTEALRQGYHAAGFLRGVEEIRALDPHTIEYRLSAPHHGFLTQLGNFVATHILPRHLYQGTDWRTNPHNLAPVGSGPFRFAEWTPGERVVLEAVLDHWGVQAQVDRLILRVVPDRDEAVRLVARGEAHAVPQDVLTYGRLGLLEGSQHAQVARVPGPVLAILGFNYDKAPWRSRAARLGAAMAIDRPRLAALCEPGWSHELRNYLPPSVDWAFAPDALAPAHDPVQAARLLRDAYLPVHDPLKLVHLDVFDSHRPIAAVVAESLRRAGAAVEIETVDSARWAETVRERAFDLAIMGGNMSPDPDIMYSRFTSGGDRNYWDLRDPQVDALFDEGRAQAGRAARGAAYRRLQHRFAEQISWVPLVWCALYFARSTQLFGWSDQLEYRVPFWHWGRVRPLATTP
ncbi:MAG: ABC transporter substrate-binding protein [Bifidobacteriaceae bacterium]|jgi:peptide/nickel transport system substrate-binding protein|nr:ABC transporter substrate-binding protein [Bifidobacteriaceae bacterium]